MVIDTFKPGKVQAVLVFKASNNETGLLWIPKFCVKQHCQTGLQNYNLGDWLIFNMTSQRVIEIVRDVEVPYETRLYPTQENDQFVEVKVPVVFFSDRTLNQVVAYSPEFGRIGSFIPHINLIMDKFYYAWIAHMALCRNPDLQMVMRKLKVDWLVSELERPMTVTELKAEDTAGRCKFYIGIVVNRREDEELVEADNADQHTTKLWTVIDIWTPELSEKVPGLCTHRIDKGLQNCAEYFAIGTIYKFVPIQNFSKTYSAVSPIEVSKPMTGIEIVQNQPTLKLKIAHEQYHFDSDPKASRLHVPKLLGPIECQYTFVEQIRRARQQRPLHAPRLFVEFNGHSWVPVDFDGRSSSPPRQMPTFTNYRTQTGYQSTSTTSASASKSDDLYEDNTTKFASATSIGNSANILHPMSSGPSTKKTPIPTTQIQDHSQAEQKKKKETENIPLPKLTVTGGFGHSRLSRNQKRTSTEHDTHQAPTELTDANVKTKNRSASVHSNAPSIASDFADKEEVPVPDTDNNENRPVDPPLPQQARQPQPEASSPPAPPIRRGPTGNSFGSRQFHGPRFSGGGTFLERSRRPAKAGKRNLSGVVVSKNEQGFYIYTPTYPTEIFLPHSKACEGLKHGSWIRFNTEEEPNNKIKVVSNELDESAPYPTKAIRNTVQIKLNGMVPKNWLPFMSTFVPAIKTDFVDEVLDSNHLIGDDWGDARLEVVIERGKKAWDDREFNWFIVEVIV